VSGFTPSSGPVGTDVVIAGSGFTKATLVSFGGTSASPIVLSDSLIEVAAPTGAKTGTISVTTPAGVGVSTTTYTVTTTATIHVESLSVEKAAAGASLVISGQGFASATSVTVGGIKAASMKVLSDHLIVATVPEGAVSGTVRVTGPDGASNVDKALVITR
jgi:hypothetical protein